MIDYLTSNLWLIWTLICVLALILEVSSGTFYLHVESVSCNKWTLGLNTTLPLGFTLKAETAWMNPSTARHVTRFDVSVGWQGTF